MLAGAASRLENADRERRDMLAMAEENFDYIVGINTKGYMFIVQKVVRRMMVKPFIEG